MAYAQKNHARRHTLKNGKKLTNGDMSVNLAVDMGLAGIKVQKVRIIPGIIEYVKMLGAEKNVGRIGFFVRGAMDVSRIS